MENEALWISDQGDGTYRNPVLFCDYSDPDAIRVGDTYYLTASSFNYVPGLPLLTSKDLVNWTLQNYAIRNIPEPRYAVPRHAHGVWAPAIRRHEGRFYIYYAMPDEGIYMVSAEDALGEWDEPVLVLPGKGLIDPSPFWDDDGRAWIVHGFAKSRIGFKSFLGIFPMSWDGRRAAGEDHLLFDGRLTQPTIEGPKVYRRGEYVYIFAPAGGVPNGWQTVLRARSILGPYEERVVLRQGGTPVNGPHQGAWVDTREGEDWFLHFQSRGLYGRVVHLQPMTWGEDGWPRIGAQDASLPEGCGIPVLAHAKPKAPACPRTFERASDDFSGDRLSLMWQFMGNCRENFISLSERPGHLRLFARALPQRDATLWGCPQGLTQKVAGPALTAEIDVDASGLLPGAQAGLALIGGCYGGVALRRDEQGLRLAFIMSDGSRKGERVLQQAALPEGATRVSLQMTLSPVADDEAVARFAWRCGEDGPYRAIGAAFSPARHTWVGARLLLFAMPLEGDADGGWADFGPLRVVPPAESAG